jgi:DNA processing protein
MKAEELFYQIALSKVAGVGPVRFKKILEHIEHAEEIFSSQGRCLKQIEGTPKSLIDAVKNFTDFSEIDYEINFAEKNNIAILAQADTNYPKRLLECVDSPSFLFFRGKANLNQTRIVSIIGTRANSDYGRRICEEWVSELKPYQVLICSGLAFGIDVIAHKAAIKNDITTVGVLANGLAKMYPLEHSSVARQMELNGGVLTEFFSKTKPNRENFPTRNRIVAGMADATIVIETDIKGGSMITAELAFGYNRDLFCIPGRINDSKSAGCNLLIQNLKGQMATSVKDIAIALGWETNLKTKKIQRQLFIELSPHEQIVVDILKEKESIHIDELVQKSNLNTSQIAGAMLNLEMQSILGIMPGKMITLLS